MTPTEISELRGRIVDLLSDLPPYTRNTEQRTHLRRQRNALGNITETLLALIAAQSERIAEAETMLRAYVETDEDAEWRGKYPERDARHHAAKAFLVGW